jgi:hexosaminidase
MKQCILQLTLLLALGAQAQVNIVPMPASVALNGGQTTLAEPVGFVVPIDMAAGKDGQAIAWFKEYLRKWHGIQKFIEGAVADPAMVTQIHVGVLADAKKPGAYELSVQDNRIGVKGDAAGRFYAFETLKQLLGGVPKKPTLPNCFITDYPRFGYRGMHLDVSRHFFDVAYVKKYIDYLAAHKFNTLHWHLTDDQGWRIEIKKYPLLTEKGAWRNGTLIGRYPGQGNNNKPYGGFYTQEEVKDIVQYAANRYITIVPEIEMPGHSSAAIAAYPQLSCFPDEKTVIPANMISEKSKGASGKLVQETWGVFEDVFCPTEYTFGFLQDVLDEVMALFKSQYIHIGGDECPKESWKRSPFCQRLMKEKGLKDEHELQSWFIQRIEKYVNSKGRQLIGWDEILEGGLAPNATVMSWRGEQGGITAAKQFHSVIMTPGSHCYFDHSQTKNEDSVTIGSYLPLEKVYGYEPVPKQLTEEEAIYVLGAQGNVWTEYITNPAKLEYMVFPRMGALAEVLWSPKDKRNWPDFERRLPRLLERYKSWGANYSNAYYDINATVLPGNGAAPLLWQLQGKNKQATIMAAVGNVKKGKYQPYAAPLPITQNSTAQAIGTLNGKQLGNAVQQVFRLNKATGKPITLAALPSGSYPGDGAFTLVNGVQNERGFARSSEFLGFSGSDCEAVVDLGQTDRIKKVVVHALRQEASWIWQPLTVQVWASTDGQNYTSLGLTDDFNTTANGNGTMTVSFDATKARYVKITVQNWGEIPTGSPGAGNKAWLFVDEVEVW